MKLSVVDYGIGFRMPEGGFGAEGKAGLIGMSERARLLKGTLAINSQLGKGTKVVLEVPG